MQIKNYKQAADFLGARSVKNAPWGSDTTFRRLDANTICVKFHDTDVICYDAPTSEHPEGTVALNTGGWYTPTTKQRLHDYTKVCIWQERGVWFIRQGDKRVAFVEGMLFDAATGDVIGEYPSVDARVKKSKKLSHYINAYINKVCAEVAKNKAMITPSAGDCLMCACNTSFDCLLTHVLEEYVHGSLIVRACKTKPALAQNYDWMQIWNICELDAKHSGRTYMLKQVLQRFFRQHKHVMLVEFEKMSAAAINELRNHAASEK